MPPAPLKFNRVALHKLDYYYINRAEKDPIFVARSEREQN